MNFILILWLIALAALGWFLLDIYYLIKWMWDKAEEMCLGPCHI